MNKHKYRILAIISGIGGLSLIAYNKIYALLNGLNMSWNEIAMNIQKSIMSV